MSSFKKLNLIVLLVFFCLPLVFAMSFEFELDKNIYEPGELINGNGMFNFINNETFPLDLELKIFLNNETFSNNVTFSENISSYAFSLSEYFEDLHSPFEEGDYGFNFTVSDGEDFFEYISIIIIPLEIVSYFPNETIIEDSTTLEIITNKNAKCWYSLNSSLNYSLMEDNGLNHWKILDVSEEKEYFVYIRCSNPENLSVGLNFSFDRVIPLETLNIFDVSPDGYITDESPEISFRTSIRAICKYSDEKEDFLLMDGMDSTNDTFHYKELERLDTGSYKYYIECHFKDQSSFNDVSFKIDKEKPSVVLHRPRGLIDYNETINFTYTPKDDYSLRSCELYINLSDGWKREKYDSSISNNKLQNFEIKNLNLEYKEYFWKVKCADRAGNSVESDKLSFIVKKVYSGAGVSDESLVGSGESDSDIKNTIAEQESENPEKYEEFEEPGNSGSFITGAVISNFGGKVKNFFNPFIFIITLLSLFLIVGIHQYTKKKMIKVSKQDFSVVKNRDKSFVSPKVQNINEFNQNFVKKDEISPQTIHKQIYPQTNERLIGNEVNNFNRFDWRESAVKGNLVDHFHWRIMMTRRRKHISRDRFAKILGESETRIRLIEEGFLPQDYEHLISKIEHYLGINLRK